MRILSLVTGNRENLLDISTGYRTDLPSEYVPHVKLDSALKIDILPENCTADKLVFWHNKMINPLRSLAISYSISIVIFILKINPD